MVSAVKPTDLFDSKDPAEVARRFDAYKAALDAAPNTIKGDVALTNGSDGGQVLVKADSPHVTADRLFGESGVLNKAMTPDLLAQVQESLASAKADSADLVKDFTLTSPLSTGYVAFDLEAPAKMLTPKPTPIRNRLTRKSGMGTARRYKRITGFTGTGTGGVGFVRPGLTDSTTTSFGSLSLNRGQKISYAGDEFVIPYLQFGLSDSVPWSAQFAGQGYEDIRQVSQTSVLYASMLTEERLMLGGRGTAAGFYGGGAFAAPTTPTGAARAAGAGETGLSGVTTNVWVKVTAEAIFGESVLSAVVQVAASNGQVVDITIPTDNNLGTNGYRVYVSTGAGDPGDASRWFIGRTGYNVYTLQGALPTSGTAASTVSADTSASALDYDGILTICSSTASGYRKRLNSALSTSNPGGEFQAAFGSLWDAVKADPDRILLAGQDRRQLSDALKAGGNANGYRLTIAQDQITGTVAGSVVTQIVNEITGKIVDLEVHPWMPQGNAPIISDSLPIPDTEVSDVWASVNVQDYMGISWPVIQQSYDFSSYWFGTMLCYAPAWNGIVQGIKFV